VLCAILKLTKNKSENEEQLPFHIGLFYWDRYALVVCNLGAESLKLDCYIKIVDVLALVVVILGHSCFYPSV